MDKEEVPVWVFVSERLVKKQFWLSFVQMTNVNV